MSPRFVIIQHDPSAAPDRNRTLGRYGVLTPVNMDGFYSDADGAAEVAAFMAEERPDLETLVVEVIRKITP